MYSILYWREVHACDRRFIPTKSGYECFLVIVLEFLSYVYAFGCILTSRHHIKPGPRVPLIPHVQAQEGRVDFSVDSALQVHNRVRGFAGWYVESNMFCIIVTGLYPFVVSIAT